MCVWRVCVGGGVGFVSTSILVLVLVCVVCQSGFGWITLTHSLGFCWYSVRANQGTDWSLQIDAEGDTQSLINWPSRYCQAGFGPQQFVRREGALVHATNVGDAVFQAAVSPSPSLPSAPVPFASKHNFSWRSGKCNHLWKWGLGIISVLLRKWWGNKWITKDLKF